MTDTKKEDKSYVELIKLSYIAIEKNEKEINKKEIKINEIHS